MFYSNVNKIFLGTDGAASTRVGQILLLRVEGSIPYSDPLSQTSLAINDQTVGENPTSSNLRNKKCVSYICITS